MNALVAKMLGEANFHSPEERAGLDQHNGAEESKEVQLAQRILTAVKSGDKKTVVQAASELIRMHHPQTAASYSKQLSLMALPHAQSRPTTP